MPKKSKKSASRPSLQARSKLTGKLSKPSLKSPSPSRRSSCDGTPDWNNFARDSSRDAILRKYLALDPPTTPGEERPRSCSDSVDSESEPCHIPYSESEKERTSHPDLLYDVIKSCLEKEDFINMLSRSLSSHIALCIEQYISPLREEIVSLKQDVNRQTKEIETLKQLQKQTEIKTREMEQYSRKDNIIIRGFPEEKNEDVEQKIMDFINSKVKNPVRKEDISIAHRLLRRTNDKLATTNQPAPIVVKFTSRKAKISVLKQKKDLRNLNGRPIIIHEHLSMENSKIFGKGLQLRKENRIGGIWTRDCKIFVSTLKGTTVQISSDMDLKQF